MIEEAAEQVVRYGVYDPIGFLTEYYEVKAYIWGKCSHEHVAIVGGPEPRLYQYDSILV